MKRELGKRTRGSTTEPSGLTTGTELPGSSLCTVMGSDLGLAIESHPEKPGNKGKGNAYRIESLRIHTRLLKKVLLGVLIFQRLTLIHMQNIYM